MAQPNKMFRKGKGMDELVTSMKANSGRTTVFVGFLRSSGTHKGGEGMNVASVAHQNEFGTEKIPERSFMRSAMNENRKKIKKMCLALAKKVLHGEMDEHKALSVLGLFLQNKFRSKIQEGIPPPNAPSTIAAKGSDHTLIDSGQMRDSVDFEVVKGKK